MNPILVVFLLIIFIAGAVTVSTALLRMNSNGDGDGPRVSEWPEWEPIAKDTSETYHDGTLYRLSLNLTVDNTWKVLLQQRRATGWRVVSTEDYISYKVAKGQWMRIYQLLPDAFDYSLEELASGNK